MAEYFSETVQEQVFANQRSLENLVRSMQMSLGKLNVLIAVCDHSGYRDTVIQIYEESLQELEVVCCRGTIDRACPNLKETLLELYRQQPKPLSPTVVTIVGTDELLGIRFDGVRSAQEEFFFSAQWAKEGLVTFGVPIVVWVSSQVAAGLAREAQDFWSGRGGVFRFENPLVEGETELERRELARSIGICIREINDREPSETVEFAQGLAELAELYEASESDELAVVLYERVLKIYRTALGDRHSETGTVLNSLAELYERTGREERAVVLYERALGLCREEWGDRHPSTATRLNSLAYVHRLMGDYTIALPLYEEALTIRREGLGVGHEATATSLNNLAGLRLAMGDYAIALPLYEEAVVMFEQVLGRSHPRTEVVRGNLRSLRSRMGK